MVEPSVADPFDVPGILAKGCVEIPNLEVNSKVGSDIPEEREGSLI